MGYPVGVMKKIAIVFFSGTGHTRLLAEALREGAASAARTDVNLVQVDGSDIVDGRYRNKEVFETLEAADAIVFGTPTYMGGVAAQLKAFFDASSGIWMEQGWQGKLAGGFTTSGSPSGDKLATLQQVGTFAAQHGMLWVSASGLPGGGDINRLGSSLGVMGHTPFEDGPPRLHRGDAETARAYGRRMAQMVAALQFEPVAVV